MKGDCPLVVISGTAANLFKRVCSSDACKQRRGQDVGYTPSAHRADPRHPLGDAHHRRRRAGHRLRLPPSDLCSQPLPHRGEIQIPAD